MYTSVSEIYKDGTVLVTGGTGFLGKVLIEKLLRSCPLRNIVLIVRNKKGLTFNQRTQELFEESLFDKLRKTQSDFKYRIKIINGDMDKPSLGLSSDDHDWIIENVKFIFHCAATIKFNEPIEIASKINIQGTINLLALARDMKNLMGFVHVSTAYSHCVRNEIKEEYYPVPVTAEELKDLVIQDKSNSDIIGKWPNTYTFTKAITENLLSKNEYQLPISIFRPSIIGPTESEPTPGWTDNMNGISGVITPMLIGFLRTALLNTNNICDIIPVDYTANALICVMWDTVNRYQNGYHLTDVPKIFNYVSSVENSTNWGFWKKEIYRNYYEAPPLNSMWYICTIFSTNSWIDFILKILLHRIPAAFVDLFLFFSGNNPKLLKMYSRMEQKLDLLSTFTLGQWKFHNNNTLDLWSLLSQDDRKKFLFSFKDFDWKSYMKYSVYGVRKYLLHEDVTNVKQAILKNRILFWSHYLCIGIIISMAMAIIVYCKY